MRFEVSAVARVPVEAAWRWWTDYGETGSQQIVKHGLLGVTRRRIVGREGDTLVMDEEAPLPAGKGVRMVRHRVRVLPDQKAIEETSDLYESRWTFEPSADGGTRVTRAFETRTSLGKLVPGAVGRAAAEQDLKHHVKEMEKDLRGPG